MFTVVPMLECPIRLLTLLRGTPSAMSSVAAVCRSPNMVIDGRLCLRMNCLNHLVMVSGWRLTPHFCEASSSLGFEAYESRVPQHSSPGSFCRRGSSVTRRGGLVPSALNAKSA